MYYLHEKSDGGAYMCPQDEPFPGAVEMSTDQIETYRAFHGFGDIANGIFTGDQALLDAWNTAHPDTPTPAPAPQIPAAELSDAMCEMDAANDKRLSAIEDALCNLDSATNGGVTA